MTFLLFASREGKQRFVRIPRPPIANALVSSLHRLEEALSLGLLLACAAACGSDEDAGEGMLTVTAYGESFIEDGIPADEVGDGWAVDFSRFDVSIRDVNVAGVAVSAPASIDLAAPSAGAGHELGSTMVAAGSYSDAGFTIANVDVEGTATKDGQTLSLAWEFDEPTRYTQCETTISVSEGGRATFQITVHADHLLYDSLVSEEPNVLFQALADADTNADGMLARSELEVTDIGGYDPGSEDGVDDLWAWLEAQVRTLGHVDGEGHCQAEREDG